MSRGATHWQPKACNWRFAAILSRRKPSNRRLSTMRPSSSTRKQSDFPSRISWFEGNCSATTVSGRRPRTPSYTTQRSTRWPFGLCGRTFLWAWGGRPQDGIQMMDKSMKVFADMKFRYFRSVHLGMKAQAYQIAGEIGKALASVDEGVAFAKESGERVVLSDLIRLSGELHLAGATAPAAEMAESLFVEAIELARAQASKLLELRAATSLARLWQAQGKHAKTNDVLYPVYS